MPNGPMHELRAAVEADRTPSTSTRGRRRGEERRLVGRRRDVAGGVDDLGEPVDRARWRRARCPASVWARPTCRSRKGRRVPARAVVVHHDDALGSSPRPSHPAGAGLEVGRRRRRTARSVGSGGSRWRWRWWARCRRCRCRARTAPDRRPAVNRRSVPVPGIACRAEELGDVQVDELPLAGDVGLDVRALQRGRERDAGR